MSAVKPPLDGVRVLDIATFLAAPFCGTVLADFGAEVIKVEQPGVGDPLRRFGTPTAAGDTMVWLSEARNKKSVTLDLRNAEGADLFRKLVAQSDVVLENFRPGTLEKWGLGYEALKAVNPRLVMLRVSAYGQTGPYRERPGFARIAHAFSGLAYLAGEAGRVPVVPGSTSLADYMSGVWGAVGVLMGLRVAEKTGQGQFVDIGLYESVFRFLDETATAYAASGFVRGALATRSGRLAGTVGRLRRRVTCAAPRGRGSARVLRGCSAPRCWRPAVRARRRAPRARTACCCGSGADQARRRSAPARAEATRRCGSASGGDPGARA